MNKFYVGIDIGKEGGIAFLYNNKPISTFQMPKIKKELDYPTLSLLLCQAKQWAESSEGSVHVVFEKLGVIFGSSKQTAFSMGQQSGAVQMACIAHKIPYTMVNAKEWQRQMFTGIEQISKPSKTGKTEVRDTKAMALVAIKRIFPELKLTFGERAEKPHDGLIDSVLIAEWAKRNNL